MVMNGQKIIFLNICNLILGACSIGYTPKESEFTIQEQAYSVDEIKAVSPRITKTDDESATGQVNYELQSDFSLLLRYSGIFESDAKLLYSKGINLWLQLHLVEGQDPKEVADNLQLCSLEKNWMPLATWNFAHPFSEDGKWQKAGVFAAQSNCIIGSTGTLLKEVAEKAIEKGISSTVVSRDFSDRAIYFNITSWYRTYIVESNKNYGWSLQASQPVRIFGEAVAAKSPKLIWRRYH